MDRLPALDPHIQLDPQKPAASTGAARVVPKQLAIDLPASRADATWRASSFDLAQGLEVKEMQSKLSAETLDRLFRS